MNELANDINGDPIEVPEQTRFWRLRRHLGGRGASVVVTNDDHAAVLLPVAAGHAEFHEAVKGAPGKYTLYPCDEHGRPLKGAAVAHVFISEPPRNANVPTTDDRDALIRELVRANTEICKTVVDKLATVMASGAELIRAADGAGIAARKPAPVELDDDQDGDEDDEDEDDDEQSSIHTALDYAASAIATWLEERKAEKEAAKAATASTTPAAPPPAPAPSPSAPPTEPSATVPTAPPSRPRPNRAPSTPPATPPTSAPAASSPATTETPRNAAGGTPDGPQTLHLLAIKAQLAPHEWARVQHVLPRLSATDRAQWLAALCARSVEDAVALVRSMIPQPEPHPQPQPEGGTP